MCNPASFVMTKNKVFWSKKTDSHEGIIKEFDLCEGNASQVNIVRIEISPSDGDIFSDPDTWKFNVDQDMLPDWFSLEEAEKEARIALKDWISTRVWINKVVETFDSETVVFIKNTTIQRMSGSSTVQKMSGSSTVKEMFDSSTVQKMYESSTVKEMYESSTVQAMYDSSTVKEMYESSTVIAYHSINPNLSDHSAIIDRSEDKPKLFTA